MKKLEKNFIHLNTSTRFNPHLLELFEPQMARHSLVIHLDIKEYDQPKLELTLWTYVLCVVLV